MSEFEQFYVVGLFAWLVGGLVGWRLCVALQRRDAKSARDIAENLKSYRRKPQGPPASCWRDGSCPVAAMWQSPVLLGQSYSERFAEVRKEIESEMQA